MPCRHLRLLALLAALLTALLTSCGSDAEQPGDSAQPTVPDGAELLTDSSEAMSTVSSTRVTIDTQGELGIPIQAAQGQLSRDGSAKGTATTRQLGQVVDLDFVIVDNVLYVRGPTGGFQKLSVSAGVVYDPSVILDPDRGIASVLASGTEATTEAREDIDGVDSYRVRATFPGQALGALVPGFNQDSNAQVWIAEENSRLVQARFPAPNGAVITLRFSDYDAPTDITPPI